MIFHKFNSDKERRSFGGSCFLELQYCRFPHDTGIDKIISVDSVRHWKLDSLYVYEDDESFEFFINEYIGIFSSGIYCNGESGPLDTYGINYYSPEQLSVIIQKLTDKKPAEYEILLDWLDSSTEYNGIYILGI